MAVPGAIYEKAPSSGPLRQGEIVSNLVQTIVAVDKIGSDELDVIPVPHPYVDFKRYFAIPVDEIYARIDAGELRRRCCFQAPYLQHLATRFYCYQARIALPEQHFSE